MQAGFNINRIVCGLLCVFYAVMATVFVIGSGISGLSCARALKEAGVNVRVLEKSRSFGGRCSSRLFDGAIIDTGAQYVTARAPEFLKELHAIAPRAIKEIEKPIYDAHWQPVLGSGPRYYHVQGNNRIGRGLAQGLDIRLEHTVQSVKPNGDGWMVDGEACDAVVCSAPWPQTAQILQLDEGQRIYDPCLTAAFSYDGEPDGIASIAYGLSSDGPALWTACENTKVGRVPSGQTVMLVQSEMAFASEYFDAPADLWAGLLRTHVEALWKISPSRFRMQFTHRWKFARRTGDLADRELPRGFFLCGDSITGSRVEDVWLAGRAAAASVLTMV
jgi:predicted NAD/FAD-dependent oxidoreductase